MNSCPNCHYTEFPFSKVRRANARKPLRCKKCGESIAKYHFAQPLLYSVAITVVPSRWFRFSCGTLISW